MLPGLDEFDEIWCCDFEFQQPVGEQPRPFLMCARELRSGGSFRLWMNKLTTQASPPIPIGDNVLFIAYYASAELGSYLSLSWPLPTRIIDLYAEFRCLTNGVPSIRGSSLVGALTHHGLDSIDATEKDTMRELAIRGGPYSGAERRALIDYCFDDVDALARLLPAMLPTMDIPHALLRGRYMEAVAHMERTGVPVDVKTLHALRGHWDDIGQELIDVIDSEYGVYEGRTFKYDRFAQYLARNDIPWLRLASGRLDLSDDAFRTMSKVHPQLPPLRELRYSLSQLRLNDLAIGIDGRNRCLLSPYRSKTGRNQPSNKKFIFGPSVWLRGLIKPGPDRAVAYIDYEQQEFGIAAALSGDEAMREAYRSGDPYLTFAKQAGAAPMNATKQTHGDIRERFKVCALAVQYGMGEQSLAIRLGRPPCEARELIRLHRKTYPRFWQWCQAAVDHAILRGHLHSVFGWRIHCGPGVNPRSLMNFPMQANGAEMLRLACCLLTEQKIDVCAPIHDAVLIEAGTHEILMVVERARVAMAEASAIILGDYELRTDTKIVQYPDRYLDERGRRMWETVMGILDQLGDASVACPTCSANAQVPVAQRHTRTVLSNSLLN